jgi:hypothetical protein
LELKVREREFIGVGVNRVTTLHTLEVGDVRWDEIKREIIHSFVKASMVSNLDALGFDVVP